ncbi:MULTISPECIES: XRE family transcriptional regulator [Pseudomonas]|uniref:XRE family transcriptional regulator n=1 Tax=Pseudomonas TaxID=286 RepID=UPI001D08C77D|nr:MULTISPECIES: XRE family transcriptional regulator [Pseudomonas]MCX4219838.1 helix-turn-helix domain-containing protein [Pseudomonas sp. MCal1]UDI91629.1 XRE family transcriptional regulator [Pseudomonas sp. IAC-BECa141]UIN55153.1 helix-turn-helix domain-containing protein [Pseudomonas kribbensis]
MEESTGNVYQDLGVGDAYEMQTKAEAVMKLAALMETAQMSGIEAAEKLEISLEKLEGMLRGRFRDIPSATISKYLNQISVKEA